MFVGRHFRLRKTDRFYDNNGISIDGKIDSWFTDDTATRFKAYHWQVIEAINGHDMHEIEQAILKAQANTTQPTLIICNTVIGLGSSVAGSEKAHGSALGAKDVANVREFLTGNMSLLLFLIPFIGNGTMQNKGKKTNNSG